LKCW